MLLDQDSNPDLPIAGQVYGVRIPVNLYYVFLGGFHRSVLVRDYISYVSSCYVQPICHRRFFDMAIVGVKTGRYLLECKIILD
jgi:hypothetical protein